MEKPKTVKKYAGAISKLKQRQPNPRDKGAPVDLMYRMGMGKEY